MFPELKKKLRLKSPTKLEKMKHTHTHNTQRHTQGRAGWEGEVDRFDRSGFADGKTPEVTQKQRVGFELGVWLQTLDF